MSFNIAYTFINKDAFTATQKKINRSVRKFNVAIRKTIRDTKSANKHMADFGSTVKNTGLKMSAFASLPIFLAFRKFINLASDAEETSNKFGEVFKGIESKSSPILKGLAKDFGLATSTSQELLSNTGDLLVGLNLPREAALKMSEAVLRLSADVGSFKNVDTARAASSLTKALLGERESLKETFKTAVNEEEVKKRALKIAMKIKGLTERQAKAMATLEIVTERNKDAIGDFGRTQESYANQTKLSGERSKELAESFGKLMLPVAVKLTKILIKVVNTVNDFSPATKKVILVILAVVAVIGPLLILMGLLASGITAVSATGAIMSTVFATMTTAASTLGAAIMTITWPVALIVGAIALLIAAGVLLWKNWDVVVEHVKSAWDFMVKHVMDKGPKILNAIKNFLLSPLKTVGKILGFLGAEGVANAISKIDEALTIGGDINSKSKSQTDINVNVKGTPGSISGAHAKTKSTGKSPNVGFNVIEAS